MNDRIAIFIANLQLSRSRQTRRIHHARDKHNNYSPVASFPGVQKGGGNAWYTMFAHARILPLGN